MYRTLDADKIVATAERLAVRVGERFPDAGIAGVALGVVDASLYAKREALRIARPDLALRAAVAAVVVAGAIAFVYVGTVLNFSKVTTEAVGVVQAVEATANTILLAGLGIVFLFTVEDRLKRRRALAHLHELRTIIHVIDMHQLTKDPSAILAGPRLPHSPVRTMGRFELTRYLDYCSEMLSLASKLAALYAQSLPDPVVVNAVNDIELLSTNLSRKIWQKIMLLMPGGAVNPQETQSSGTTAGAA